MKNSSDPALDLMFRVQGLGQYGPSKGVTGMYGVLGLGTAENQMDKNEHERETGVIRVYRR